MSLEQRIYSQFNIKTGTTEWFFSAREGDFGPFGSNEIAMKELCAFIDNCIKNGHHGGRESEGLTEKQNLVPNTIFFQTACEMV